MPFAVRSRNRTQPSQQITTSKPPARNAAARGSSFNYCQIAVQNAAVCGGAYRLPATPVLKGWGGAQEWDVPGFGQFCPVLGQNGPRDKLRSSWHGDCFH